MPEKIFIAVDGGGTKCQLIIEDIQGRVLGRGTGGPSNIRLSVENTWCSIQQALEVAQREAQIDLDDSRYEIYAGMGLAGCEVDSAYTAFLNHPHFFKKLILKSDGYTACLGAHAGKDGAIIIIGTGVVGMQIEGEQVTQVGGWGFPHSDEGGGAWLGLEAVRLTLRWLDHRESASPLLKAILKHFSDDPRELIAWSNAANSTGFASLTPIITAYADQNDPCAVRLLQQAARAIQEIAFALERQASQSLHYSLLGGVAPFIEPWLIPELQIKCRDPKQDATAGAMLMIKREILSQVAPCL